MKTAKFTVVMVLCLALAGLAVAQGTLGRVAGTVRDVTGAVVPGATVTLKNDATGLERTAISSDLGAFQFSQVPVGTYTVTIQAGGFRTALYTQIEVDPGKEYSLVGTMEVGTATEVVEVVAGADLINTTTSEIVSTVSMNEVNNLPLLSRNPIVLIRAQAGAQSIINRANTVINGGRPTWTQVTQDGINIQDNFIRTNSLDFVPNRPTTDSIGEFTIVTNNQGVDAAGGSSQVKLVSRQGTNEFHGSAWWYNRSSALAANSWFNNAAGLDKPFLLRNQYGGRIAGPVVRNRLFFSGNFEEDRQKESNTPNNTIPAHDDYLQGVFRYVSGGNVHMVNVMTAGTPVAIDPVIQSQILSRIKPASQGNNFNVGNSNADRLLNTIGSRFNQKDLNLIRRYGMRFDLEASSAHRFEFVYNWLRQTDDRGDLDTVNATPKIFTASSTRLIVGAWRWSPTPRLQNELRIGTNMAPVAFESVEDYPPFLFAAVAGLTNPVINFQPQGRNTRTRQYINNASYISGNHSVTFGGSMQQIRVSPYNAAGRFPTVTTGFSTIAPAGSALVAANFPAAPTTTDLNAANALRAFLSGTISQVSQTFQVRDRTSGFVPGLQNERHFLLDNWNFYAQDSWRVRSNLTLRAGLKWEYFSPLRERDDLMLFPVNQGGIPTRLAVLDPSGSVDFVNGGFYNPDRNNFGPSVGFAWDPFKDGKTSIRGGYTLAFINEETITVARNAGIGNAGLEITPLLTPLFTTVNAGVPQASPVFKVPRTYLDQLAASVTSAAFGIDQNIKQPMVHQISFGVQRELPWNMAAEVRYVANLGRGLWQGLDFNQNQGVNNPDFLADFIRARSNGFLALAATGTFNPAFNAAIAGSQPLTFFPTMSLGGLLTNTGTIRPLIQSGEVGSLADIYVQNRGLFPEAPGLFLRNPNIYVADEIFNGAQSSYHGLQTELRRRLSAGLMVNGNYTFSKVLSNSLGTSQARFEPYLDNARPELEKSRAIFDVRHVINGTAVYDLPFGPGKMFGSGASGIAERIIGGWQISGIVGWQSGSPFSILSGRGTFNRGGRSGNNTAIASLSQGLLQRYMSVHRAADGRMYFINPSIIDPTTGRAVGPDNFANTPAGNFNQVLFHPGPGEIGNLGRLSFTGPSQFAMDFGILKNTKITERWNAEYRVDFFNVLNTPSFFVGDQTLNSANFGRITSVNVGSRIIQMGLRINF